MRPAPSIVRDRRGSAAVEMVLVMPILLMIMFGAAELGNYFMNEHSLVKAVRDGARFAARQPFSNYTGCSGAPGGTVVTDTRNVVMNGYVSGGTLITPNIQANNITVSQACASSAGGQQMLGIYRDRFNGTCNGSSAGGCAQMVTVAATVNYRSILSQALGWRGVGVQLYAASQAAVTGA